MEYGSQLCLGERPVTIHTPQPQLRDKEMQDAGIIATLCLSAFRILPKSPTFPSRQSQGGQKWSNFHPQVGPLSIMTLCRGANIRIWPCEPRCTEYSQDEGEGGFLIVPSRKQIPTYIYILIRTLTHITNVARHIRPSPDLNDNQLDHTLDFSNPQTSSTSAS